MTRGIPWWETFPTFSHYLDLLVALSFLGAGVVAWRGRRRNRMGPLMVTGGVIWLASQFPPPLPVPLCWAFALLGSVWAALFAHLVLAFPTGRLGSRAARVVVAAGYLDSSLVRAARLGLFDHHPATAWFGRFLQYIDTAATMAIGLAVLALQIVRWRHSSVTGRRAITIVLGTSIAATVMFVLWQSAAETGLLLRETSIVIRLAVASIPLAYLATLLRNRIDRAGVADLVVRLNGSAVPDNLPQALAETLHDPTLVVGFWVPDQRRYVDREGREVALPAEDSGRVVTRVDRGGARVAVLIHDPALLDAPELVDAACAAAALALENERLAAELRARLNQLAASRGWLVHAAAVERRRLERDLHDGIQQRLLSVAMTLGLAESTTTDDRKLIGEAKGAVLTALAELRAVCHGIHPPVLTERGLPGAVREMTAVAPVPTELDIDLPESPPPEIETVTYYVVAEALSNIGKHAAARHATVSIGLHAARLVVEVVDDGRGGADPAAGSGLRGLAERVEANGGRLTVTSPPGQGTTIRAVLPCES